eukprot:gene33896-38305_t
MGLLKNVIWIKPPWTDQIPDGEYNNLTFGFKAETKGGRM